MCGEGPLADICYFGGGGGKVKGHVVVRQREQSTITYEQAVAYEIAKRIP